MLFALEAPPKNIGLMPVNRNALLRYKTIDRCLQNRYRRWTLDDLIEACSEALYEYEGIDKGVSRRTVQLDLQTMRSDKLGYNAPIVVVDKRYYTYEDPNYSITNSPLTEQDLNQLNDAVGLLKQFKGFSHFQPLSGLVQKLEDHLYAQQTHTQGVIELERNDDLKGLEHLETLYQAIIQERSVAVTYQSFQSRNSQHFVFHAYLLKEYNNRWFVIGRRINQPTIINLALDRIQQLEASTMPYERGADFNPRTYYQHTIGVSVAPQQAPEEVRLLLRHRLAPYVLTKPLHPSQREIQRDHYGVTIALTVQHNLELERVLLGFGEQVQVLAPERLERNIRLRLDAAEEQYRTQVSARGLRATPLRLDHQGWTLFQQLYPWRAVKHLTKHLNRLTTSAINAPVEQLLERHPSLLAYLLTRNLTRLLQTIAAKPLIVDSQWHTHSSTLPSTWGQLDPMDYLQVEAWACPLDATVLQAILQKTYMVILTLSEKSHQTVAFSLLSGSHKRLLTSEEQQLIHENSVPAAPELALGSVLVHQGLLLTHWSMVQAGACSVLTLVVSEAVLPAGWAWRHGVPVGGDYLK